MIKKILMIMLVVGIIALAGCSSNTNTKTVPTQNTQSAQATNNNVKNTNVASGTDTDKDGIPDNAETVLGTNPSNPDTDGDGISDKEDKNSVNIDTEFVKTTGPKGFIIKEILVENNYDPIAKKDADDHLEIFLKNTGSSDITNMQVFYSITDLVTNKKQSYIVPLTGFSLKAGSTESVHIDSKQGANHFKDNPNSIYHTSMNKLRFDVIINAQGYEAQEGTVKKDAGGKETAD